MDKIKSIATWKGRSYLQTIEDNNAQIFKQIIHKKHPLLGNFWSSCMNHDKITKFNHVLKEDLKSISQSKTSFDIMTLIREFSRTGIKAIVTFGVGPKHSVVLMPAELTLPTKDFYFDDKFKTIETEYRAYIDEVIQLSGFTLPKRTRRVPAATSVIKVERLLAALHTEYDNRQMSIMDATKHLPITVGAFVNGLGLLEKSEATRESPIIIEHHDYFKEVERIMSVISLDDLKVYLSFALLHSRVQWLGNDFYQAWFKFFGGKLKHQKQPPSRSNICINSILTYMPDLVGEYFYQKTFNVEKQTFAEHMIKMIKEALGELISNAQRTKPTSN